MTAYNYDDFYIDKPSKLSRVWRRLVYITQGSSDLRMKRVWIDKKPGDFARPLGCPDQEWRIYLLMRLQILEIWYSARGVIQDWQHAGIGGRGLNTAWSSILEKVIDQPYIYEFDIKGFFDQVSNQHILADLDKGWEEWCDNLSNTEPTRYKLPPRESDIAYKEYEPEFLEKSAKTRAWYGLRPFKTDSQLAKINASLGISYERQLELDMMDLQSFGETTVEDFEEYDALYRANQLAENQKPITLAEVYPKYMNGEEVRPARGIYLSAPKMKATEADREKGRDNWKDLTKVNAGFPQGANTSPFLSCLSLWKVLGSFSNLLMYMDDGLIYGPTRSIVEEKLQIFKERLGTINLKLAEEKSQWVKIDGEYQSSFKFLGIRTEGDRYYHSDTRSGTRNGFTDSLSLTEFLKTTEDYGIKASQAKAVHWVFSRDDISTFTKRLQWANNKGFLSNIIAIAFNEQIEEEWMEKWLKGIARKYKKINRSKGLVSSISYLKGWKDIPSHHTLEPEDLMDPLITSSTLCCESLLKHLKASDTGTSLKLVGRKGNLRQLKQRK